MRRQSYTRPWLATTVLVLGCAGAREVAVAPSAAARVGAGYVSVEQVERGRASFELRCGECHPASEMRGDDFDWAWRRQTAWHLFKSVSETMPEDDPGGLASDTYLDVVAYILSLNGYAVGGTGLAAEESALRAIALGEGAARSPG